MHTTHLIVHTRCYMHISLYNRLHLCASIMKMSDKNSESLVFCNVNYYHQMLTITHLFADSGDLDEIGYALATSSNIICVLYKIHLHTITWYTTKDQGQKYIYVHVISIENCYHMNITLKQSLWSEMGVSIHWREMFFWSVKSRWIIVHFVPIKKNCSGADCGWSTEYC